ncbi:uncharacterized protein LOC144292936 [Canis aureus]
MKPSVLRHRCSLNRASPALRGGGGVTSDPVGPARARRSSERGLGGVRPRGSPARTGGPDAETRRDRGRFEAPPAAGRRTTRPVPPSSAGSKSWRSILIPRDSWGPTDGVQEVGFIQTVARSLDECGPSCQKKRTTCLKLGNGS